MGVGLLYALYNWEVFSWGLLHAPSFSMPSREERHVETPRAPSSLGQIFPSITPMQLKPKRAHPQRGGGRRGGFLPAQLRAWTSMRLKERR